MSDKIYTEQITVSTAQASAGVDVNCGFEPKYVKVINETQSLIYEWVDSMADTEYIKISDTDTDTAEGSTPDANGVLFASSGGITGVVGDIENEPGFSIAAGLCTATEVLHVLAMR